MDSVREVKNKLGYVQRTQFTRGIIPQNLEVGKILYNGIVGQTL